MGLLQNPMTTARGGTGHEGAKLPAQRKAPAAGIAPLCPVCSGPMWDNRDTPDKPKLDPRAPDYKCRNKECSGAIWPPKDMPADDRPPTEPPSDAEFRKLTSASEERGAPTRDYERQGRLRSWPSTMPVCATAR